MKALRIALIQLFSLKREPKLLFMIFLLPAFMLFTVYAGYSSSYRLSTYKIGIHKKEFYDAPVLEKVRQAVHENGKPVFSVIEINASDASRMIEEKTVDLIFLSAKEGGKNEFNFLGDGSSVRFSKAGMFLGSVLYEYNVNIIPYKVNRKNFFKNVPETDFQIAVPGMMVFAVLLLIPQTAILAGRDRRTGILDRYANAGVSPFQYFTGLCISQAVCGFLQLVFMLLISVFIGFRISEMNLIIFFISGILLIFASASMGVLLSGFIKDDSEALNAGSAVSMVQVFLSGAFFAFPGKILFMLKDTVWNVWDLIPATEAVLIWNAGFGYGIFSMQRLVWLSVLAVIWYIFGYKIYELKEKK